MTIMNTSESQKSTIRRKQKKKSRLSRVAHLMYKQEILELSYKI